MRHTKRKIVPFVFASGLLASSLAQAAQLGRLEVLSGAGEPFLAEIQVDLVAPEERATLQAKLASSEAFKAARLTMDPNLKNLQFAIQDGNQPGTALVKVTSTQPLPAGFIDTLVELTWAGGRVAREYTLTIPVGPDTAATPSTSLPEIRPPMTPPPVADSTAPRQEASVAEPAPATPPKSVDVPEGALEVKRGDTLSELAMQLVGDGVTLNQAMAALYEANKDSFINGSVHLIREGAQIQVPNRAALRARNANEALLVLAQNDDRNVYSAYARQIGLLTVENQATANASTSTQGNIAPQPNADSAVAPQADRLQIAPGAAQGQGNADANAEELLAKNKALAEANERIALLEKNVSDLQRLLDMQKDMGGAPADSAPIEAAPMPSDAGAADEQTPAASESPAETGLPAVDVPSETLGNTAEPVSEPVEPPVAETPLEEAPFDWLPWILAGAGGLVALVVLLLVLRARRKAAEREADNDFDADDESSFSEVQEFDEAAVAASASVAAERTGNLNQEENSDFDLDEVLNDRLTPAEPEELKKTVEAPVPAPEPEESIPALGEASEDSKQQVDSLDSEVTLEFPDEPAAAEANSILDDLDEIEKGTLAAQEELDEIRKQPSKSMVEEEFDASAAFDELAEEQSKADDDLKVEDEPLESDVAEEIVELDTDVPSPKVDDATWQEVATKLDLAGAYVEIGDADGAKELLNEIVKKGDVDQVRKAKALLATLN